MSKLVTSLSLVSLLVLGAGCWDTPLNNTTIATRGTGILFHGYIPVPHGGGASAGPLNIYANGALLTSINLTTSPASTYKGAVGLYDWYEIKTTLFIGPSFWSSVVGGGYKTILASYIQSGPGASNYHIIRWFNSSNDLACVYNAIAANATYESAGDDCNGLGLGNIFANQ